MKMMMKMNGGYEHDNKKHNLCFFLSFLIITIMNSKHDNNNMI